MSNLRRKVRNKFYEWLAWKLPRRLVKWCFIRLATEGSSSFPADQKVSEVLKRWENKK